MILGHPLDPFVRFQEIRMKLTKDKYIVSRQTIEKVLDALDAHWFYSNDEDEYNNDDVIEADKKLQIEIKEQEET